MNSHRDILWPAMRTRFKHSLPLSEYDLSNLWGKAILTADANVLLNLYRLHDARDALLDSLGKFAGRLWLCHQAAEEFFRNRHNVIADGQKRFDKALSELKAFDDSIASIRGLRVVPRSTLETLQASIRPGVDAVRAAVTKAKSDQNYFDKDPVLERLLALFEGAVGPEPSAEEKKQFQDDAARRLEEKRPPGYCDKGKSEDRAYGDYYLWRQILTHAKEKAAPIILVTADLKEDWWEITKTERRLGLRRELREEAAREAGQEIYLCDPEHFMTESGRRFQVPVGPGVISDIRTLENLNVLNLSVKVPQRGLLSMLSWQDSRRELRELVETVLERFAGELVDSEEVSSCIAETNASGFWPYQVDVTNAGPMSVVDAKIPFQATIYFEGRQEKDAPYCGDKITVEMSGSLTFDGYDWSVLEGYDLHAEVDQVEPEDPPYEKPGENDDPGPDE